MTTKPKILIVDDEPTMVEIIEMMTAACEYETRSGFDGLEAISIAKEFAPDCVITGHMMPKVSGLEAAITILQFLPNCKFIFCTGAAYHQSFVDEYKNAGFDPRFLFTKPFTRDQLLDALALAGFSCAKRFRSPQTA